MHEEISVLIIEDEPIWSDALAANLEDFGFTVVGIADNFESAVISLNKNNFDIVLLDINLHNKNSGIELGKMLCNIYKKPFIFITGSYDSHTANEAVLAKPSAYLIKPVNPVSLFVTIQSALNNYNQQKTASDITEPDFESFFVKQGNKYVRIDWKDVVYLSSEKKYTSVFNAADKQTYLIRSTLSKMLRYIIPQQLQSRFIQVNRAEAVQVGFINEITHDEAKTPFKSFTVTEVYAGELKGAVNLLS